MGVEQLKQMHNMHIYTRVGWLCNRPDNGKKFGAERDKSLYFQWSIFYIEMLLNRWFQVLDL